MAVSLTGGNIMSVKLTVNLPEDTVEGIKQIAEKRGITVTEALRQALETHRFLDTELRQGSKVLLEKRDRSLRQLVFPGISGDTSKK